MKKKIIWVLIASITLVVLFFIITKNFLSNDSSDQIEKKDEIKSEILTENVINRIKNVKKNFIIVAGINDCDMSRYLIQMLNKDSSELPYYYFNIKCGDNIELQECFNIKGFPTSFIFNENFEVIGKIDGMKNFKIIRDSILNGNIKIVNYNNDILNSNFQALLTLRDNDISKAFEISNLVPDASKTIFNNYISYKYYLDKKIQDSTNLYKNKIIRDARGVNIHVYNRILNELGILMPN